jgi:hypothetical protein
MSNDMLAAACAYARMKWGVFPLHTVVNGVCTCGKAHADGKGVGKHPRTARGFKDATDDLEQIRKWWARWPDANIGIATGSGLVVIDIDGREGMEEFKALVAAHGAPPATLLAQTGNGFHAFYLTRPDSPQVRSSAVGKVHVRGEGGYVVAAPSRHASGRIYTWIKKLPVATLPDWLRQWSQGYEIANKTPRETGLDHLGQLPAHLSRPETITRNVNALADSLKPIWSPAEQARLISALSAIPANQYETWFQVGMALKDLGWERPDGTDLGFVIWDEWSQTCREKYAQAACEAKWDSFRRSGVSVGTLYHLAQQHGWNGGAPAIEAPPGKNGPQLVQQQPHLNGRANGHQALPAAFGGQQPIFFADLDDKNKPKSTCTNAGIAVAALGIECRKDLFHEKMTVGGHVINQWAGDLSDDAIQMIRKMIRHRFGFDPKTENTRDACTQLCLEHQYDPVLDYLDGLAWDGQPRLDTWLQRYMGAPDTELNRAIGRLTLIAAVRRVRWPGTKFDQIVVFESGEGKGKSTAIEILAGPENFSDQSILAKQDKEQQEAMCGIWLYEIADLTGMKKADIEHVKAFASRKVDRARPAYGRFRVDRPRRTVFFATTNDDEYLKSQTGNRRFWPVTTSRIDLAGLQQDRDQIWAEAAHREAAGETIALPGRLWKAAGAEQEDRMQSDGWVEPIANYLALKQKTEVTVNEVLCDNQFIQRRVDSVTIGDAMRAAAILKNLGYEKHKKRIGNATANMWRKKTGEIYA